MSYRPILYLCRRRLLEALLDYAGAQDFDTVAAHPRVLELGLAVPLLRTEWRNLLDAGFLEAIPGYHDAVAKLAPRVRSAFEATKLPPYEEFLFGPEVFR